MVEMLILFPVFLYHHYIPCSYHVSLSCRKVNLSQAGNHSRGAVPKHDVCFVLFFFHSGITEHESDQGKHPMFVLL